jgi:hypothetical protein
MNKSIQRTEAGAASGAPGGRALLIKLLRVLALAALMIPGCGKGGEGEEPNPFLEDMSNPGKEDTGYMNPDGIEVEVDIEADVEAPSYRIYDAPAELGQFALTYLRNRGEFYLESLAEDATSDQRVEWLVDGSWLTAQQAREASAANLRHFRIRGINAVLLFEAARDVDVGSVFKAKVPVKPYSVMTDAGEACADPDSHLGLDATIYWYMWNPDKTGCQVPVQDMTVTVSRMLPAEKITYPEFDQLLVDGRITAVILFGGIDDDLTESDPGVRNMATMASWLKRAGFTEVTPAPVGKRFSRIAGGVTVEIDLYSPYDFSGLGDMSHFSNFQKALGEHEIVAYDGHSMLGASDFWSRPTYPSFYQVFLYGGCLGYEYYVRPILEGKGGWDKVDIVSSVVEVSASANDFAAPFLSKIIWALDNGNNASWKDLLRVIRERVGDSTFGASGVRGNCYSPAGPVCTPATPPGETRRYESTNAVAIPDNDPSGVTSVITVPDALTAVSATLELDVTHAWVGDLRIILSHGGTDAVVWDRAGGSAKNISQSFTLDAFAGKDAAGDWTLRLVDGAAQDQGTLNRWALVIEI